MVIQTVKVCLPLPTQPGGVSSLSKRQLGGRADVPGGRADVPGGTGRWARGNGQMCPGGNRKKRGTDAPKGEKGI